MPIDVPTRIEIRTGLHSEHVSLICADVPIQVKVLDEITTALGELRPHIADTASLDEAEAATKALRGELLASPQPRSDVLRPLWLQLSGILKPLSEGLTKGAGTVLGAAATKKVIELVSEWFQ